MLVRVKFCFKMLLCYKTCYTTCCKTCNIKRRQIILCKYVPLLIKLKNRGTIYGKFGKHRYHLWYILKTLVPNTIVCRIISNASSCQVLFQNVNLLQHAAKHTICYNISIYVLFQNANVPKLRYHLFNF
jgi:hypothetical protein